jgi:excisionase family DNA binding protein
VTQKQILDAAKGRSLGTPDEVSQYLGVPVQTLYQWRNRSKGPRASRVGRHLRYRWADVEKWLDEQAGGAAA